MKLKKIFALLVCASVMLTGCIQKNDDVELSEEEKEHNAVIAWFENDIFDNEEFTDLTDYQYYARTIGLEKDELLSPDMWEVYYSESININKEIDGSAVYLIRLNPDKLLEVWAANNDMTAEEICTELGTNRDDLYYNFGYTANSIGYAKNHKDNKVSYPEAEERIFGVDNGENRQAVFSTHFLKVHTGGKYKVTYESTEENLEIRQRDLLKSITKSKTYNYTDYSVDEYTPAFTVNDVGIKRIQLLALPNGWANAKDTAVTIMFNMSPFSYGCTDEDKVTERHSCLVIHYDNINTSEMKIGGKNDETFGEALSRYMSERQVTISELSRMTGIAEATLKRYRGKCYHDVVVEYVVSICVALHLYIEQSLHLLHLAGKALTNSEKHRLFYFFLCVCYNSSITINDCNLILNENGYANLV